MARQFKKVLCPIDFSTDSFTALDYATDFARQSNGQLVLMHVVDNPLTDFYGPRGANFYAEVEHAIEKSKQMLAEVARTHASGVPYEVVVKHGNPYTEILDLATAQHARHDRHVYPRTHGPPTLGHRQCGGKGSPRCAVPGLHRKAYARSIKGERA